MVSSLVLNIFSKAWVLIGLKRIIKNRNRVMDIIYFIIVYLKMDGRGFEPRPLRCERGALPTELTALP